VSWKRRFDDPIVLPDGHRLVTLQDAGTYILRPPKVEQNLSEWQTAIVCLIGAAEGRDFGDSVEVLAGLSPSDRVIDNPPETLTTGDVVRVAGATPQSAGVVSSSSARQWATFRDIPLGHAWRPGLQVWWQMRRSRHSPPLPTIV
jgi:hypothetical protein